MVYSQQLVVLRARKGVPGIGRKLANHFGANEVTCGFRPKFKVPDNAFVLNYGRSAWPIWYLDARERGVTFLNTPSAVVNSVDKRLTLELLSNAGVKCLDWTTSAEEAYAWYLTGDDVIVRTIAQGKQGKGIELCTPSYPRSEGGKDPKDYPNAPLFTRHYTKDVEFRVHVVNGEVIDYVQKKRMGKKKRDKLGLTAADELIRNHKRGWVFAHNDIIHSELVKQLALDTVKVLGLDYAGIDILAKVSGGKVYDAVVCESNSAPGMSSPTTFKAYTQAFNRMMEEKHV